jgi:hypothetical protein
MGKFAFAVALVAVGLGVFLMAGPRGGIGV